VHLPFLALATTTAWAARILATEMFLQMVLLRVKSLSAYNDSLDDVAHQRVTVVAKVQQDHCAFLHLKLPAHSSERAEY
jgi:hypothetical protein